MKVTILYDSAFGNTERIAQAIGSAFADQGNVTVLRAGDVKPDQIAGTQLLIVGSPTQRFRPTVAISNLIQAASIGGLKGTKVAAFDTRLTIEEINKTPILAFFVRLFGHSAYAASHIATGLRKNGGELIASPEGFYVEGMEGPLVAGELDRAMSWAKQIKAKAQRVAN